ncbi:MAG TPA: DegT/DnrJ/EryC1/StrS family aminotransferase, partial [Rhizomicrobium sp.]
LGDCGTFSFYPSKNLGAYGDAGFVTCAADDTAAVLRKLRDHGRTSKYEHQIVGYNQRMDALQGAILSVKLRHLDAWIAARRRVAARYDGRLRPAGFKTIEPADGSAPVYHLYVFETSNREEVAKALAQEGIETGIHYPLPLHLQPAFADLSKPASLPVTERVAGRVLSLPMYPELDNEDVDRICEIVLRHARC